MTNTRIYFMDPLRGVLMALGVVLHAGQVFNPENTWLIHSAFTTPIAEFIIHFVHVFRMPAFYIVSGFFALFTLKKYGTSLFLKLRAEKILIPFVVTAVVLNSFQAWLLYLQRPEAFSLSRYFTEGLWVSHLWFLGYLFAYVAIMYVVAFLLQRKENGTTQTAVTTANMGLRARLARGAERIPIEAVLLGLPFYYLAVVIVGKILPAIYEFRLGFSLYDLLNYFQFFAFGVALCWSPSLFQRFTRISLARVAALLVLWLAVTHYQPAFGETVGKVLEAYARFLITWIACHLVFSLFKTIADRPSKLATFTSSVSYTVYLFHHSLVILFGLLFIHFGLGGLPGFVLLTAVVATLGIGIHVLFISRYNWASFLFNGVRLRR